jgi:hypothetical protein
VLVHDSLVLVHRAAEADAPGIALLHANTTREQIRLAGGQAAERNIRVAADETAWRGALRLSSGDHRPWVAWRGDRVVGFVTAGPSRDSGATHEVSELYVFDADFDAAPQSGATTLLEHACRDLSHHGFTEVTVWVGARDLLLGGLLRASGWTQDGGRRLERIQGIPILQFRYRMSLG